LEDLAMKVFLSWSGELSHKLACAFRDWLPQLLNAVTPYVSSEDIDKGERWSTDIAKELEASNFGIVLVTASNLKAPWLNFEAGALSKTVSRSNVVPFLFGIKRSEVHGPLLQFQSTLYEKSDVEKLVQSVNRQLPEDDRRTEALLHAAFEVWWPHLQTKLDALTTAPDPIDVSEPAEARRPTALLEEVLDLVRSQQKLLRSPESLLPVDYLNFALGNARHRVHSENAEVQVRRGHNLVLRLRSKLKESESSTLEPADIEAIRGEVERLHEVLHAGLDRSRGLRHKGALPPETVDPSNERA
jgi:hypothetical protein